MKLKLMLLGAAALSLGVANAASSNGLSINVNGGYSYADMSGSKMDAFDFGTAVNYNFENSGFNFQGAGNYRTLSIEDVGGTTWNANGTAFWRGKSGMLGFNAGYNSFSVAGSGTYYENYGFIGEWFATDAITARGHLGGLVHGDTTGYYTGVGATYYVLPDLALNLDGAHNNLGSLTWSSVSTGAEYLVSKEYPLTVGVSYTYSRYSSFGASDSNAVMIRLSYRIGDGASLVELDRSGTVNTFAPALPS